ncbi:MAG: fibronectin type III domain-containing protein [Actinomycetes bacterium]
MLDAPASATSLTVTGLTAGTAYECRVAAVSAIGRAPWSALASASVLAATPTTPESKALAHTGASIGLAITIGLILVLAGIVLVTARRRRTAR